MIMILLVQYVLTNAFFIAILIFFLYREVQLKVSDHHNVKLKNVMQRSNTGGKAKKSNAKTAAFKEKDQGFMKQKPRV